MEKAEVYSGANPGFCSAAILPEVKLAPAASASTAKKVLLLEDDPVQLSLLKQHVAALGYQVLTSTTIQEATRQLSQTTVDLAIFDVQLPDGSGFDLCEKIDSDSRFSGMPIVVLSSMNEANAVRKTRAAGARYFICKPYDPNVLLAILERALDEGLA